MKYGIYRFLMAFALLFALRSAGHAADTPPAPEVVTLQNGARLVTLYEPDSPLVSIDVFFCVGADDEGGQASRSPPCCC